jgi:hypothetical protein
MLRRTLKVAFPLPVLFPTDGDGGAVWIGSGFDKTRATASFRLRNAEYGRFEKLLVFALCHCHFPFHVWITLNIWVSILLSALLRILSTLLSAFV